MDKPDGESDALNDSRIGVSIGGRGGLGGTINPDDFAFWFLGHDILQKAHGFFQSFAWRQQTVFVLDREGSFIADRPKFPAVWIVTGWIFCNF
jgi:hypothetical protein